MHKRITGALGAFLAVLVAAGTFAGTARADQGQVRWDRLAGDDRYGTSIAIAGEHFSANGTVVVASGENFHDALAGTGLAGAYKSPVLLVRPNYLGDDVAAELERLGASHCIIVGDEDAVASWVASEIEEYGISCERVSGYDRQDMSLAAMTRLRQQDSRSDTVVVANGYGFADALSAGPFAWKSASPVLLTDSYGQLSEEQVAQVLADSGITRVLIAGGPAAVSTSVEEAFEGQREVVRLGGADRYARGPLGGRAEHGLRPSGRGLGQELPRRACRRSSRRFPQQRPCHRRLPGRGDAESSA